MSIRRKDTPRTSGFIDSIFLSETPVTETEELVRLYKFCRGLEMELNAAVNCINSIEAHYKAKHGESYDHTTLHTIIENWRSK